MLKVCAVIALAGTLGAAAWPSRGVADVIAEDKGLYKKETWNIQKYYDDLDDPTDAPGVITSGRDPEDPSGPALDFQEQSDLPEDRED